MRHSVSKLIGKFVSSTLTPSKMFEFKSTKRKLKREWNRCGHQRRIELRRKMEDVIC